MNKTTTIYKFAVLVCLLVFNLSPVLSVQAQSGPDLTVVITNDTSDSIEIGGSFYWNIRLKNEGDENAVFNSGFIFYDNLPGGAAFGSLEVTRKNISTDINCILSSGIILCSADYGQVTMPPGSYFDLKFSVTPSEIGTLMHPRSGTTCKVDPDDHVAETNEINNEGSNNNVEVTSITTTTIIENDDPDPTVVGQPYTVTVRVANGPGTGTVNVDDGDGNSCQVTLSGGTGSCDLTSTTVGVKTIAAAYAGGGDYEASSITTGHMVYQADTTTTINSVSSDSTVTGEAYTVNVSVAAVSPGAGTPTGVVNINDGIDYCNLNLSDGSGSCSLVSNHAGSKSLVATYQGNTNYNYSSSEGTAHTVNKANTTTTIDSVASNPTDVGEAYSVSASVAASAPGGGTPEGTITVSDGSADCTMALSSGSGNCFLTSTSKGTKTLTATYNESTNYNSSESSGTSHTVNGAASTTLITSVSSSNVVVGEPYTVSFSVFGSVALATGTVTVADGSGQTCSGTLSLGAGSCELTSTTTGSKTITASYAGDSSYNPSLYSASCVTVTAASTTTTITSDSPDPSMQSEVYKVEITVSAVSPSTATPSGSVCVQDGVSGNHCIALVNGSGSVNMVTSTTGSKTLTAIFSDSSGNFSGSQDTETHTIVPDNKAPTNISLSNDTFVPGAVSGSVVGSLTTSDPDGADTHTYSLVSGEGDADNASFQINGAELQTKAVLDRGTYFVRIRTTDNGTGNLTYEEAFVIDSGNDLPTGLDLSSAGVTENESIGTVVGTFTSTDPDDKDTFTYSLVAGTGDTDNTSFVIAGDLLLTGAVFDYDTKSSYSIRVRTTDNYNGYYEKTFTITINDAGQTAAGGDSATVQGGETIEFEFGLNDSPSPEQVWNMGSRSFVTLPQHGTASFGSIIYTPDPGFEGVDTFSYRICDTGGYCAVGEVSVTVTAAPVETLPATGFTPGVVSELPPQTIEYDNLSGMWIEIPAIQVKAPIVGVPVVDSEWDVTWLGQNVGYLYGTAYPTHAGNTALSGHVFDSSGLPGIFYDLHRLQAGSFVYVHADGLKYTYEVKSVSEVSPQTLWIINHQISDWITLITCQDYVASSDTYLRRTVVKAVLVGVTSE